MSENNHPLYHAVYIMCKHISSEITTYSRSSVNFTLPQDTISVTTNLKVLQSLVTDNDPVVIKLLVVVTEFLADLAISYVVNGKFSIPLFSYPILAIKVFRFISKIKSVFSK
jgi:hypothetical protein